MQEKYIELLINRCMDLKRSKVVFISYNKEIKDFIDKLVNKLNELEVTKIYREEIDPIEKHNILKNSTLEEIRNSSYFDCSIWDEYAKENANFIMFETEVPHLMDDIEPEKLAAASKRKIETKPIYRALQEKCQLLWAIVAYPGKEWAESIYAEDKSYELLENSIYKMCMLDQSNPIKSWDEHIKRQEKIINKLNNLNLNKLHYTNSLGTDLYLYLPNNYRYESALDNGIIVNMPSYEIFTSPIYNKTEGIVYSSIPLNYNGVAINEFYLKFKNGKVIEYDAKAGKDVLKEIIESDKNACYLGEAALVEVNSPISKMKTVFGTTLIDENASCHLAIGAGFPECIVDGLEMNEEELQNVGINISKTHVDFMVGTNDLQIIGYTKDNKEVKIFENGCFSKEIID